MITRIRNKLRSLQTKFSFGSSSAIITNLALMAGLHSEINARVSIIGGILVIALADNVSDSFGIHIYQESEKIPAKEVWISTFFNFTSRVLVSLSFVFLVWLLPLKIAIISSIIWGFCLLASMSYLIAKEEDENPYLSILTHLLIAAAVITLSNLVGDMLITRFGK